MIGASTSVSVTGSTIRILCCHGSDGEMIGVEMGQSGRPPQLVVERLGRGESAEVTPAGAAVES